MAESLTIARPYAQAAFLFADQHHALKDWSEMLQLLAAVATDPAMADMIENPQLTDKQVAGLFISIGGERLNEKCNNFIHLLAENGRLGSTFERGPDNPSVRLLRTGRAVRSRQA